MMMTMMMMMMPNENDDDADDDGDDDDDADEDHGMTMVVMAEHRTIQLISIGRADLEPSRGPRPRRPPRQL